VICKIKLSLN